MKPLVVMAAWRADLWIEDAVRSIRDQTTPVDLTIAVDGCWRTARLLSDLRIPFWWSEENVGPYLLRNSLILQNPESSHYLIFDADDVMDRDYVQILTAAAGSEGLSGCASRRYRGVGPIPFPNSELPVRGFDTGRPTISRKAWSRLGGFRSWRVSSDTDLWWRARQMGLPLRALTSTHLVAREHPESQMANPLTGLKSTMRSQIFADIEKGLAQNKLVVHQPETVKVTYCG